MHKHTPTILAICGLVLIAALWLYEEPSNSQTEDDSSNVVTIVSTPLPTLPTHDHSQGDAVEDDAHGVYVTSPIYTTPRDMWISEIQPIATGAPFAVVHHLMLHEIDAKDHLCTNLPKKVLVVGMDNNKRVFFPEPFGYFIKKDTKLQLVGMLHNPEAPLGSGDSYSNVSAGFTITVANPTSTRNQKVDFYMLSAEDPPYCQDRYTFTVPAKTIDYAKSSEVKPGLNGSFVKFDTPGTIVGLGTHTHGWQGGRNVDVFINSKLYRSFTTEQVGNNPEIWSSTVEQSAIRINKDDTITLTSHYTNPSDVPIRGAMGIIGFYFAKNAVE